MVYGQNIFQHMLHFVLAIRLLAMTFFSSSLRGRMTWQFARLKQIASHARNDV